MIRLLLLTCALLLALDTGYAQCPITRQDVERTTRVFMLQTGPQQLYSLKRTVSSPIGEVLRLYCSPQDIVSSTCLRTRVFQPRLPLTCRVTPAVIVQPVQDRSCRFAMYRIGYRGPGTQFMELYRACFDTRAVRAVFVVHRVFAKPFYAQRPCVQFSSDGIITRADEASYSKGSIYSTFRALFGNNQQFIPNNRDVVINRGHLAASGDFLFCDQMCATFKYVNAVPQFETINSGNWATIERWVRDSVQGNNFVNVRTGATGVLRLSRGGLRRDVYLNGRRNPVPEWMYKRVDNPNNRQITVFLTYNNKFATARPAPPRFCVAVNCPPNINLSANLIHGYTICCDPRNFNP